jgi:adenosylhomocysteinase
MKRVADESLAPRGELNFRWAWRHMPTLVYIIEAEKQRAPLKGLKVGVCLHVTKETAVFVKGLQLLGAEVYLAGANPLSTQDDIAAFLLSEGVEVWAWKGETADEYYSCIRSVLSSRPNIQVDDGADAHVMAHREGYAQGIQGGTEETTTGVQRLRALEAEGGLAYPIIAVNNANTKYLFDNRYGTGQSALDGILRATSLLLAGKVVVVAGYGWVGRGVAARARGLGARVVVTEVNPIRALEAYLDGFEVMDMSEAARIGDLFVTCTGQVNVIDREHIELMKDGAILANAGHFDVEVNVAALRQMAKESREVRPFVTEFIMPNGRVVYLLAEGRVVNLVCAEGHPPEVMMMSFANQLLSVLYLAKHAGALGKRLLAVPPEIDEEVARVTLRAYGIKLDALSEEQVKYFKKV